MRRRSLIAALGIAVAGCSSSTPPDTADSDTTPSPEGTPASPIRDDTIPIGESITFDDQVRVTVDEARLANTVTTDDEEAEDPGDGSLFLLVHVSSTNVGEEQADLASSSDFALLLGSEQRDEYGFGMGLPPSTITAPISGDLYEGESDAFADVSSSGWLVYSVPVDTEHAVIAWGQNRYDESKQAYWRLNLDPGSLSNVQLTSVDVPDSAVRYQPTQITLTIENTGGSEGTYETTIGEDLYDSPVEVNVTVPPHETVEEQVSLPYPELTFDTREEATISIDGNQYTITYSTPTRQLGQSYQADQGLEITVYEVETGTELRTYNDYLEEYETVSLADDERWVYVNWEVENTSNESMTISGYNSVALLDNGAVAGQVEYPLIQSQEREFRGTVTDDPFTRSTLGPGEITSGYVVFRVPIQHKFSELDVMVGNPTVNSDTKLSVIWEQ